MKPKNQSDKSKILNTCKGLLSKCVKDDFVTKKSAQNVLHEQVYWFSVLLGHFKLFNIGHHSLEDVRRS